MPPSLPTASEFARAHGNHCHRPLHADLEAAWLVQRNLFPREMPVVPGWDFAALCQPARTVAGDYYDLFEYGPGRLALALGDVSGKGLGPALVMAGLRSLVRCLLPLRAPDLTGFLHELNRNLLATTPDDMFVTLFLAILDVGTGRLHYLNAGHPPALVLGGPTQEVIELTEGGTVLGILADAPLRSADVVLAPGSRLVLYSDGLTEAVNAAGEMFREERLRNALRRTGPAPAGVVLTRLVESVQDFARGLEPADDLSLVIVHRQGDGAISPGYAAVTARRGCSAPAGSTDRPGC